MQSCSSTDESVENVLHTTGDLVLSHEKAGVGRVTGSCETEVGSAGSVGVQGLTEVSTESRSWRLTEVSVVHSNVFEEVIHHVDESSLDNDKEIGITTQVVEHFLDAEVKLASRGHQELSTVRFDFGV